MLWLLTGWGRETGLSPPVKYFTDCSKAVLLLLIICVFCVSHAFASLHCWPFIAALWSPAGKGLTSWLFLVMFIVFSLLSHVASWVRCGT